MQVFGFGKRRPAIKNGVEDAQNDYSGAPSPPPPAVNDQPSPVDNYKSTSTLMRSPFEESLIESRVAPVSADVSSAVCLTQRRY